MYKQRSSKKSGLDYQQDDALISSSSLVSKTVIVRQAVLLALDPRLPKPSQD